VSISITAIGEPFAICVAVVALIGAAVVCWAITDPERSTRLTALVSAWRSPRGHKGPNPAELSPASKDAKKAKRL
jgi:hypothetical protein